MCFSLLFVQCSECGSLPKSVSPIVTIVWHPGTQALPTPTPGLQNQELQEIKEHPLGSSYTKTDHELKPRLQICVGVSLWETLELLDHDRDGGYKDGTKYKNEYVYIHIND